MSTQSIWQPSRQHSRHRFGIGTGDVVSARTHSFLFATYARPPTFAIASTFPGFAPLAHDPRFSSVMSAASPPPASRPGDGGCVATANSFERPPFDPAVPT